MKLIETLTRFCNLIAAAWLLFLAFVVLYDVVGRGLFNSPFLGAKEIISNSVVAILFLQIPFAVLQKGMYRTTIIYERVGAGGQKVIDSMAYFLGVVFFIGVGVGGWPDMIQGYEVGEFEGISAFELPTWPVRGVTVFWSFFAAIVYLLLLFQTITGTDQKRSQ